MSRSGLFATLAAGTAAVVGIGLLAKRRQQTRLPKNPSGIADANLSIAERREAAEEFNRLSEDGGSADFQDSSQEGTSG